MAISARRGRMLWQATRWPVLLGVAVCWVLVVVTPFPGEPGGDASVVGAVALTFAAVFSPVIWLPISLWPSLLAEVQGNRLRVPTYRGIIEIDLDSLASVDARTLPMRGPSELLSLRDSKGGRVIIHRDFLEEDVETPILQAITRASHVRVSPRAAAMLGLPGAPGFVDRLRLSLVTGAICLGAVGVLAVLIMRIAEGAWPWDAPWSESG